MKVHYVLLNKEYLTKQNKKFLHVLKIPVMFILSIPLSQHCLQYCLTKPIPARFPKCISKIRLSSHNLAVETGRFNRTTRNQRKCIYSNINCVEDEFHFILVCPLYDIFRKKYIKPYFWRRPSMFKLVQLLSSENVKIMNNL